MHKVVQTPGRWGSPAVPRAGETASIVVHAWQGGQLPSPAAPDDRGVGLGAAGRGDQDDPLPRWRARLLEPWRLGDAGLEGPRHGGLWQGWPRAVVRIDLAARLARGPRSSLGAGVGDVEGRRAPPRGHEGHVARPGQSPGAD